MLKLADSKTTVCSEWMSIFEQQRLTSKYLSYHYQKQIHVSAKAAVCGVPLLLDQHFHRLCNHAHCFDESCCVDVGCVDEQCRCRDCKLASVRCIDGVCCHAPVACGCVDMTGHCCPGGWASPCQKLGLGCLSCITCGSVACKTSSTPYSLCLTHYALLTMPYSLCLT